MTKKGVDREQSVSDARNESRLKDISKSGYKNASTHFQTTSTAYPAQRTNSVGRQKDCMKGKKSRG